MKRKIFWGLGIFIVLAILGALVGEQEPATMNATSQKPSITWDITKLENKILLLLKEGGISPKIEATKDGRIYFTKYSSVIVEGYPDVSKINMMTVPTNDDDKGNVESIILLSAFVGMICNQEADKNSKVNQYMTTVNNALREHSVKKLTSEHCNIEVHPPESGVPLPIMVVYVDPIK